MHAHFIEKLRTRNHCGDVDIGGRIILKWVVDKQDMKM
jgi:hypothetical protein